MPMQIGILANGQINDYLFAGGIIKKCGYVIACDGGLRHTAALSVVPDIIVGDMDSADIETVDEYIKLGSKTLKFPAEKDDTDLALSMEHAISLKPSAITILGALGGRFDHQLANIHVLLSAMENNIPAAIIDEICSVELINKKAVLKKNGYNYISLIPLTAYVNGITTFGLLYPLKDESLRLGTTRGVSNQFTGGQATIALNEGILIAIRVV